MFLFSWFIWLADGRECPEFAPGFIKITGFKSGILCHIDAGLFSLHFHMAVFLSYNYTPAISDERNQVLLNPSIAPGPMKSIALR